MWSAKAPLLPAATAPPWPPVVAPAEPALRKSGAAVGVHPSTVSRAVTNQRRITRRMVLNKQNTLEDYAAFLRGNAIELGALYSDALISVTSFFRNPEAFDVLQRKVFPKLLQQRGDEPVRVWVLGCSTGQEAYSIGFVQK